MRKKHVKKFLQDHGKNYFSEIAGRPHKRGASFKDPEILAKALETRRRNRELKANEVPTDDNV